MDVLRLIVLILVAKQFANAIELISSSATASVGVDFMFSCVTNIRGISFTRGTSTECVIAGGNPDGTCNISPGYNKNYEYDCSTTGVYKLTIPGSFDIDTLHGSEWKCAPVLQAGQSDVITLYVNVPITQVIITTLPTDMNPVNIVLGTDQQFTCKTNAGRPSSMIHWFLSGRNISDFATPEQDVCNNACNDKVISSSGLTYKGNKSDNEAILYCTAVNVNGHSVRSENKSIAILYGPSFVTIFPTNTVYMVNESTGTIGPVNCSSDVCKPACSFKWSGPNLSGYKSSVLKVQNIYRNQTGNYYCTAYNSVGNKTSVNISVFVNYGPNVVTISPSSLTYSVPEKTGMVGPINCTADCKPECTMIWSGPYIPNGQTSELNLQNIYRNHAGKYICNASNMIGTHISAIVTVIVNYGPGQVKITPDKSKYMVTETTGYIGPITCAADCNPNCTMVWNGPYIPGGTMYVLHLLNIDRNQTGNYICTATNTYGSTTSTTVNVIVNYGPRQVKIVPTDLTYTARESTGSVGPISCTADCKPECTMSWIGPNLPGGISTVLYLQNISRIQAGNYSCDALNAIGSQKSVTINVIVNYGPDDVNITPQTQHYIVNETGCVNKVTCTADCNPNCTMTWTGRNFPDKFAGSATSILNLHNITRNQSGTYHCNASNNVGSQISLSLNITVNFRPDVTDILGNRSFNENETAAFSCKVESVPSAKIKWVFKDTTVEKLSIVVVNNIPNSNKNYQISNLNISRIRCLAMGTYTCAANNIIGEDAKDFDIDVKCSPRINSIEFYVPTLIAVKDQEPLNITAPIIAYPKPDIYWTFFNNETLVNVTRKTSHIFLKNRVFSNLYIENVTETDFGHYRIHAVNGIGSTADFLYSFEVVPKRKPSPPDNVTCIGRSNSVLVYWKSNFDGGDTQLFQIFIKKDGSTHAYNDGQHYKDPGQNRYLNAAIQQLTSDTTYHVSVQASNKHNISMSDLTTCNTTSAVVNDQQNTDTVAIGAGTGTGGAIIVLVIAAVVFIYIRRRKVDEKIGQDKEPMHRYVDTDEDNDDGLKDNPLYVSSTQEDKGAVYSVVDKKRKTLKKDKGKLTDEYTQVVIKNKKDKKNTEIEMGYVYQNSENNTQGQNDEMYANSGKTGKFGDKEVYTPTKNKDGLIYADLDLAPTMNGNRFVIRGLENRNNYAVIDLTKTAEPMPSDSDSDDDKTKATHIEKEEKSEKQN